jgi:glycosyltransferase involved in cell wall biosynthesis
MRILWVKVGGLWPLSAGGRLRSFHLLKALSARHTVTLLTTHGAQDDPARLAAELPGVEVISVPYEAPKHGSARFALALAGSWCSSLPVDLRRWRVPALVEEAARRLAAGSVDLCVADFLAAVPNLPETGTVPVVLFEHNVEHMIWRRLAAVERNPLKRVLLEVEWRKLRRIEARALASARLTLAVSEADAAALARLAPGGRPIRVVPTGVDTTYFQPNDSGESTADLVFTGSMDWYPNEDAILYFIDAMLPRIRAQMPAVTFSVVGRTPSAHLRRAVDAAGGHVSGAVPDVRPYVERSPVYVVPLRIGGGTRLKIFEALAMGKAVVSTTVGAEGLPIVDGLHYVQADEPGAFADAVVALLGDGGRRRALGQAGRQLVEDNYSWTQVARTFESACLETAHAH